MGDDPGGFPLRIDDGRRGRHDGDGVAREAELMEVRATGVVGALHLGAAPADPQAVHGLEAHHDRQRVVEATAPIVGPRKG